MTSELEQKLKQAETLQEVAAICNEASATMKNLRVFTHKAYRQLGRLMAHRRDAGLMNKGGKSKKEPRI